MWGRAIAMAADDFYLLLGKKFGVSMATALLLLMMIALRARALKPLFTTIMASHCAVLPFKSITRIYGQTEKNVEYSSKSFWISK